MAARRRWVPDGGCLTRVGDFTRLTVTRPGTHRISAEYGPSPTPEHCCPRSWGKGRSPAAGWRGAPWVLLSGPDQSSGLTALG
ncbi:hypothetical protein FPZ41_31605 [Streptomyces sp. K1PN6]|uniref:Uncharacterized protein n=1 Tax=Streptomyces acidicola TaxID=2596892 RepID=A0A5N8WZQ9_9ACTN|nr:hypothetical protein [Streptomyces acidicola]